MKSLKHKLIINPKVIDFLNNMEHLYASNLINALSYVVKDVDKNENKLENPDDDSEDMNTPKVSIYVKAPKRIFSKPQKASQIKSYAKRLNGAFDGDNFKQQYNDIVGMINHFKDYMLVRTEIKVCACLSDPRKDNKIIEESVASLGKVQHDTFVFKDNKFTGGYPIDVPMVKPVREKIEN